MLCGGKVAFKRYLELQHRLCAACRSVYLCQFFLAWAIWCGDTMLHELHILLRYNGNTVINNAHFPYEAFKYVNNTNLGTRLLFVCYPERGNIIA